MKKTSSHKPGPRLAPAALLFAALLFSWGFSGCGTRSPRALDEPPIITSATYQHTLYNGQPQPISAETARPGPPPVELTYFPSEEALFNDQGGTSQAPVEPGRYYVRIRRPEGNGYAAGRDISVEYTIQKALLHIVAEESQSFPYDGSPKPVRA
ncbi:MAG: hypothetical protein LBQ61_02120, partial [Spirochaetales bacterium]|nr:hypothetical protein [Spirochaetales bacterium]